MCPFALALLAILAAASLGCVAERAGEEPVGQAPSPIAGGYEDAADTAVVGIVNVAHNAMCSGSLVAPNVVLTARHCVSDTLGGELIDCAESSFGSPWPAGGFLVTTAAEVTPATAGEFFVSEVVALPVADDDFCGQDLAILVLAKNVPDTKAVPYEPRLGPEIAKGEEYSAIGFGAVDGAGSDFGKRRRRDDLVVECVGTACATTAITATEFAGDEGVCQGDSGGPAVDLSGRVVGVTSRGGLECESSIYGHTVAWAGWLKDTVVYASGMGQYEPPGWTAGSTVDPRFSMPVGDPCSEPGECPAGYCVDGYCTRPCDETHACPSDYGCRAHGGVELCLDPLPTAPPATPAFKRADKGSCALAAGAPGGGPGRWLLMAVMATLLGRRRRADRARRAKRRSRRQARRPGCPPPSGVAIIGLGRSANDCPKTTMAPGLPTRR